MTKPKTTEQLPTLNIDEAATRLVRQAIADLLAAQSPSIQAASAPTFNSFMERCVVLAEPTLSTPI